MISIDTLLNLLTFNNYDTLNDFLSALLAAPQLVIFLEKSPALKKALIRDLPGIKAAISEEQKNTPVPASLAQEFHLFSRQKSLSLYAFSQNLPETLLQLEQLSSPFAEEAQKLAEQADKDVQTVAQHTLFFQRWRLNLTLQTVMLNETLLEQQRDKLIAELQQRMALSGQLSPLLAEDEEAAAGQLWDMSKAPLQKGDTDLILQYSDFLSTHPELQTLAEQLGRSREAQSIPAQNAPPGEQRVQVHKTESVPEEVSGIHQSDDVLRLLPPELAALSITELELEFYRRLVEKRLLTYQLQGESVHEDIRLRPVTYRHKDQQPKGPFIICVDTSGSMGGFNERCAKAFCLALLKIALTEKRGCFIMLFAHEVISYELTADNGLEQAIRFLSQRFRGGTDLALCLSTVLDKMALPAWQDADAVIISDFIAQHLPEQLVQRVAHHQQHDKQRFHAVSMSAHGKPAILKIFDHIWKFDTRLRTRLLRRIKR